MSATETRSSPASMEAGPYLRALAAGLHALAPDEDFVPLRPALAHVYALDPGLGGTLLAPMEIERVSGMPAFHWMERARAEQVVARERSDADDPTEASIAVARRRDPELALRLEARTRLHRHLRREALLPATRAEATPRRIQGRLRVVLTYDRLAPEGHWIRLRADLEGPEDQLALQGLTVDGRGNARVAEGLAHLLTRHCFTPLQLLREQVEGAVGGRALRLSRGVLGPFWFPGMAFPHDAPASLRSGLVLHASREVAAVDIAGARHRDPWRPPPPSERYPDGVGVFRERSIAVSPSLVMPAAAWGADRGTPMRVVSIRPGAAAPGPG